MPRSIDRRQALAAFGTVSLGGLLAACGGDGEDRKAVTSEQGSEATVEAKMPTDGAAAELFERSASCSLTAEQTEGPYYFDVDSIRRDIREDRPGAQLRLAVRVRDAGSCKPLENAIVDIWHCDAGGVYSGFESASRGGQGGGSGRSDDETYLRGAQATNADGVAEFITLYPGWYPGRTVHIHAKVHLDKQTLVTTQLYFDDDFTDNVFRTDPYSQRPGRDVRNDDDGSFDDSLVLTSSKAGRGFLSVITFDVEAA